MESDVNSRSEHLQLTDVERHPYSPPYSPKKYAEPETQRCKDISQKSFPKQKNSDAKIQESLHAGGNSATENSDNQKDTNDADLHEDKSISRCPEIRLEFHSDEDMVLMESEVNSRPEHLQLTDVERHPYNPPYSPKKYAEPEAQRCKDISQKSFPKQKNSDAKIEESLHVDGNTASSTKILKTENSDNQKDTNDADLHEEKNISRCPEIRQEFHSDEDTTFLMESEVNSRSEHLQSTDVERHPYSPQHSPKKYAEPEEQRCKDISQKSFPKQKNSDAKIQESLHVGGNSATENSDNQKDTNDAELHEENSTGRYLEIGEEFHFDENATLPMEFEVNSSKEADIRCSSSLMEIKLTSESLGRNKDNTNQGTLRAKSGTASKEKTNKSTMKVAENSVSLTPNIEIRIPESLGNKPDERSSHESTTDTCIDRHSHISQEFGCDEDAIVPIEPEINPRSQHLQFIDVERHSEISMNHLEAEVQHCNNRFHNLFRTENETHHIWDNCLEVCRSFENQDEATLRRGAFLEDAAELNVNEFPNGSTTDHISMCGDVVTVYGSAPLIESSCLFGEVRLSETVRPIDEHNGLIWDDSVEDDDAPISGQHSANSEDTMDSTDTLPSIRRLLSLSGVQLRTSFIGVNSFQRDSNPNLNVSAPHEAYQNESIEVPYEMDESFVTISGSGPLSEPFNGSGERCFQVRFSETVRPISNRNS